MRTKALLVAVALVGALSACSASNAPDGATEPPSGTPSATTETKPEPTETKSEREIAEENYLATMRGPVTDAGYDFSAYTDAQLVSEADSICQQIDDVEASGGAASIEGIVMLRFVDYMGEQEGDDSSGDEAFVDRTTAIAATAVQTICAEHSALYN